MTGSSVQNGSNRDAVLIVEDDKYTRGMIVAVMEADGYVPLPARDGEEGLQLFLANRQTIRLIISDVIMPKMTGRDLYEKVWEADPDIPMIFISGYPADIMCGYDISGRKAIFIQKPFTPAYLIDRMRWLLNT